MNGSREPARRLRRGSLTYRNFRQSAIGAGVRRLYWIAGMPTTPAFIHTCTLYTYNVLYATNYDALVEKNSKCRNLFIQFSLYLLHVY